MAGSLDMEENLDSLWILNNSGLCLLHRIFDSNKNYMDESMVGGFLVAIISFTQNSFNDSIEKISLGKFDIYFQSFERFIIVVSSKKGKEVRNLQDLISRLGNEFQKKYYEILIDTEIMMSTEMFESFGETIDTIFGIKTVRIIPEHYELLDILTRAESVQFSEEQTINAIIKFFESLKIDRRKLLLKTSSGVLDIFKSSKTLNPDLKKQFNTIMGT